MPIAVFTVLLDEILYRSVAGGSEPRCELDYLWPGLWAPFFGLAWHFGDHNRKILWLFLSAPFALAFWIFYAIFALSVATRGFAP